VDIAANDADLPGLDVDDDVTVGSSEAFVYVVVGCAAVRPSGADEVADLRRAFGDPIGPEGVVDVAGFAIALRGGDVGLVGARIGERLSRASGPHHPGDEHGAPGIVCLPGRILEICRGDLRADTGRIVVLEHR